ncbi:MAG: tyrosine-type recombinase/integrase [Streptosporangiaceae bacterium]
MTPENATVLAEYADHLVHSPLTGHSPRTYLGAVRAYLTWLQAAEAIGDPLSDAMAKDWAVRDYRSYLVTVAKRATTTVNKHLAALQDFYVWRGLGQPQGVKRHQVPRHAPKALEPRAKLRYLRAVEAWPNARDRAIALLPLFAGTRIAEVTALDVADVRLSARKGEVYLVGKGEKSRTVPVHPKLREALAAWLDERSSRRGAESAALFTSSRGTRMTTDAIADVLTAITNSAGLDDHVTSHVLRHTFGTELTRRGVDLVIVAELMGHASLETTRLYTNPRELHQMGEKLQVTRSPRCRNSVLDLRAAVI